MHGGGGGVGRSSEEGGGSKWRGARCQPVKDAGTIQSEECVEQERRGGFISRWTRQTTKNIPSAKDANANNCVSICAVPLFSRKVRNDRRLTKAARLFVFVYLLSGC